MSKTFASRRNARAHGFTLLELMVSLSLGALLLGSLNTVLVRADDARQERRMRDELRSEGAFALARMSAAVRGSERVFVPTRDDPRTESRTENSRLNILAVSLDPTLDRNRDGRLDADNDDDGRVDEDLGSDIHGDSAPGILQVDDDGDGDPIDELATGSGGGEEWPCNIYASFNDDEDEACNEDPINGLDDDGDGRFDEDPHGDLNDDGLPGIGGFDDNGNGTIDDGHPLDNDEDGKTGEDWFDVVAFSVVDGELIERFPSFANSTMDSTAAWVETPIASNVDMLYAHRVVPTNGRDDYLMLILVLSNEFDSVVLTEWIRIAAGL